MVLSMKRWNGMVAVVTGASSGIGEAIVKELVQYGLKVVGLARREDRLQQLETALKETSQYSGVFYWRRCDVSQEQDIIDAFKWITSSLGHVAILVNNAGVAPQTNLYNGNYNDWKTALDVNVLGLCAATKEAIRSMQTANPPIDGHIININSISGHYVVDFPDLGLYPSSKFAVTALSTVLRNELKHLEPKSSIKVTSISPGLVATEMTILNPRFDDAARELAKSMPCLKVEDIADGVVYALSTAPHVQIAELIIRPVGEMY